MYIATVLKRMGLRFEHEKYAEDGCADWRLAVGRRAAPWGGDTNLLFNKENVIVLHQVRYPLDTIASCMTIADYAWEYICNYIPASMDENLLIRSMKLYYYWNKLAEEIAVWRYRIESLEDIFDEFCEKIGHPELKTKRHILKEIPKDINSAKGHPNYRKVTWKQLERKDRWLTERIREMAESYGYF